MAFSQAFIPTPNAEKYLRQLCKHWAHRFPATYTPFEGWIPFSAEKVCKLDADDGVLRIRLSLADQLGLEEFETMVADHLRRFAFREGIGSLSWSRGDDKDAPAFATVPDFVETEPEATGIFKDHIIRVGGRKMVLTYAEGPGQPLLLFHGLGGSGRSFIPAMPALEAAGFRPLAVNMPGYGGSDPLGDPYPDLPALAAALRGLLDEIALARADVVGHSLGGLLAAVLAHEHPERVGRMVLSSPPRGSGLGGPETWDDTKTQHVHDLETEGAKAFAEKRAARLCAADAEAAAVDAVRREMERVTPEGLRVASSLFARSDLVTLLSGSPVPVHFLSAQNDRIVPAENVTETARLLGRGVTEMPAIGHAAYVEDAPQFAACVLQSFQGLPEVREV